MRVLLVAWCLLLAAAGAAPATMGSSENPGAPPAHFEDVAVGEFDGPTEFAFTPDGRILVSEKNGLVEVYQDGQILPQPALDLTSIICEDGERGISGLTVHPAFFTNHYLYIYYTVKKFGQCGEDDLANGPVNRLSRFILDDNSIIDPASEEVLLDTAPLRKNHHNGGALRFGSDGLLYVTIGDGGNKERSPELDSLFGKVLRLTDSGGIPAGNPYTGTGTVRCSADGAPPAGSPADVKCQEVFAGGLRNPWELAFDPDEADRFFISDVGQRSWEEINEGASAADYGWPVREGACLKDSMTNCPPPPAGVTDPVFAYSHDSGCAAITGGAFLPNGVWPATYDDSYFYADLVCGKLFRLIPAQSGGFTRQPFADLPQIVRMHFGPYKDTQALYYVTRETNELRRIAYTGAANRSPTAVATAKPTFGEAPLRVRFNGSRSSDPDGDRLTYEWDFGDGTPGGAEASPAHTYSADGVYLPRLTVQDEHGARQSTLLRIDVGNSPPRPRILSPARRLRFAVGQRITLLGRATDADDGVLPPAALEWEVILHHGTHTHPFLAPTSGSRVAITAPEPEDFEAAASSYLEIRLTATDSSGLETTVSQDLRPKFVPLTFKTVPAGLRIEINGSSYETPVTVRSWKRFHLQVSAPDQVKPSGIFAFKRWSDGGAQSHTIRTPSRPTTYTALFQRRTHLSFLASADAYVSREAPGKNHGSATILRTDAAPATFSYIRFDLTGLGKNVKSAKLRVWANSDNAEGYEVRRVQVPWQEEGVTYRNAPPVSSRVVGLSGGFIAGGWTEVDLTSLVSGDGILSIALTSSSNRNTSYASRESGPHAPQLVITFD